MWTKAFWKDAIERAVKTAAQSILSSIAAVNAAHGDVSWKSTLIGIGVGAGLSVVTSVLSSLVGSSSSASLVSSALTLTVLPLVAAGAYLAVVLVL